MHKARLIAAGAIAALLFASGTAFAQQQGSVGMDEIDASVSAESGDEMDANLSRDEAIARLKQSNQDLSDRMDDIERRLRALEQRAGLRSATPRSRPASR